MTLVGWEPMGRRPPQPGCRDLVAPLTCTASTRGRLSPIFLNRNSKCLRQMHEKNMVIAMLTVTLVLRPLTL